MSTHKQTARVVGSLILLATVTYMLGNGLLNSILHAPDYLRDVYPGRGQVISGVLLEFVDAAAVAVIGIMLFPVLRKHNETIALGYAGTRIIECALLLVAGISSLLLISLSQHYAHAGASDASSFQNVGAVLVAQSELAFQIAMLALGLGSIPFCYLLFTSRLIPRYVSVLGLIGYPALAISAVLEIAGYSAGVILYIPGGLFELIFPIWLIVKGFKAATVASQPVTTDTTRGQVRVSAT